MFPKCTLDVPEIFQKYLRELLDIQLPKICLRSVSDASRGQVN